MWVEDRGGGERQSPARTLFHDVKFGDLIGQDRDGRLTLLPLFPLPLHPPP